MSFSLELETDSLLKEPRNLPHYGTQGKWTHTNGRGYRPPVFSVRGPCLNERPILKGTRLPLEQ